MLMVSRVCFKVNLKSCLGIRHSSNSVPVGFSISLHRLNTSIKKMNTSPNDKVDTTKGYSNVIKRPFVLFFKVCGAVSGTILISLAAIFVYDYSTYTPLAVPENLIVPFDSINPTIGGPENLPILKHALDSYDSDSKIIESSKKKLVILGCGWGSVSLIGQLNKDDYDVTVISPTNYFLFTPLLPSATVGTLDIKSLMESIRYLLNRIDGHYIQAKAEKVEFNEKLIKVEDFASGKKFYVPYDKLVVAVGSTSNTHGVKGLEHTSQLKTAHDALKIKNKIFGNLEKACLPTTSDSERKRLLSFVVCGGGPTGVEMAAEIYDLINEDMPRLYPKILRQEVSIHIIQSRSHILNTYDNAISEYAMKRFKNDNIDLLVDSRVKEILPDRVVFTQKESDGMKIDKEIEYGLCLWSTGIGLNNLTHELVQDLKPYQKNKRAIETDSHLRVIGTPMGEVYAIGDCSSVKTDFVLHLEDYVRNFIISNNARQLNPKNDIVTDKDIKDFTVTTAQLRALCYEMKKHNPLAAEPLSMAQRLVSKYDTENSGYLKFDQLQELFREVDSNVTSLPATAQRASQQGIYLGKKLSKLAGFDTALSDNEVFNGDIDDAFYKPFRYNHLGSLAYLGNSAVFDLSDGHHLFGGLVAMYLWRSVYFAESVSLRTRAMMFFDWLKRGLFGRDVLYV